MWAARGRVHHPALASTSGLSALKCGTRGTSVDRLSASAHQDVCALGSPGLCLSPPCCLSLLPSLRPLVLCLTFGTEEIRSPGAVWAPSPALSGCKPHIVSGPQVLPCWAEGCGGGGVTATCLHGCRRGDTLQIKDSRLPSGGRCWEWGVGDLTMSEGQGLGLPHLVPSSGPGVQ